MMELFKMGGPLFMGILTLQLIGVAFFAIRYYFRDSPTKRDLDLIKSMGVFAMVTGIFGQLLGLFSAFNAIEAVGAVSPSILAAGIKVSMISTIYGVIIFLISYLIWLVFAARRIEEPRT